MRRALGYVVLLSGLLVGCGGGGGGDTAAVAPTPTGFTEKGTALFEVDVNTGNVKVSPLETSSRAVLAGAAASFTTTTLLNETGEVGRRSLKVQLKNNLTEAIGVGRPVRIQFGVIGPATGYQTDLRPLATVSTLLNTPGPGFQDGPANSAQISAPTAVVSGTDGSIYFNGTDNRVRKFSNGYVSTVAPNVPATSLAYVRDSASGREFLIAACGTLNSIKSIP